MTCIRLFLSFMFLILLFLLILITQTSAQTPIYMYSYCQNTTEKSLTPSYQSNVNNLLLWINSNVATGTDFDHTVIGSSKNNNDDVVYGNYDCRGGITGYLCQFCIDTAVREISQHCTNSVTAGIWYDICIIRYSNKNFFGKVSVTPSWNVTGTKKVKDEKELGRAENYMGSLIRKVTIETNESWAGSEFNWSDSEKRYGFVACARDLNKDGCRQCLEAMLDRVPLCCGTKVAWTVVAPSCGMRFDDQLFFQLSNQTGSSSPMPNPGNIKFY